MRSSHFIKWQDRCLLEFKKERLVLQNLQWPQGKDSFSHMGKGAIEVLRAPREWHAQLLRSGHDGIS